jgi:hypothetical protein
MKLFKALNEYAKLQNSARQTNQIYGTWMSPKPGTSRSPQIGPSMYLSLIT